MGNGFIVKCNSCGYEDDVLLGIGMSFPSQVKDLIKQIKDGEYGAMARDRLKALEVLPAESQFDYFFDNLKNEFFYCKKCKTATVKPFFKLYDFIPEYKCPNCNSIMHKSNPDRVKFHRCPECGKIEKLEYVYIINWD